MSPYSDVSCSIPPVWWQRAAALARASGRLLWPRMRDGSLSRSSSPRHQHALCCFRVLTRFPSRPQNSKKYNKRHALFLSLPGLPSAALRRNESFGRMQLCWDTEYSHYILLPGQADALPLSLRAQPCHYAHEHSFLWPVLGGRSVPCVATYSAASAGRAARAFVRLMFCLHSGRAGVPQCALHLPMGARAAHSERIAECNE